MSSEEGLLQAILDAPEDDTTRLIYADWLEEHGRSESDRDRAEFIRAQCELAKLAEDDPRGRELSRRAGELLRGHFKAWTERLPELEGITWDFVRGFAGVARAQSYQAYHRHEEALFRVAPVQRLRFSVLRAPAKLAASPGLARVTELDLAGTHVGDAGAQALAASPYVANLTWLGLADSRVGDAGAAALAASPQLARLTHLNLGGGYRGRLGPAAARALAASPHLVNLTQLVLRNSGVGDDGLRALAAGPGLPNLTRLNLANSGIGPAGVQALAEGAGLARLTHLDLERNRLGDAGVASLANRPHSR